MKKSIFIISAALVASGIFAGCKSAKVIDLADYAPVTIATVYSNSSVPWYEKSAYTDPNETVSNGGLVTSHLNNILEQNNPEYQTVQSRIDEASDILIRVLEENGIPVTDKALLQKTATYNSGYNKFMDKSDTSTSADGYLTLDYAGKGRNRAIATATESNGTIFAEFIFQKEKEARGFTGSSVRARVTLKVYVADKNGNKVLYKTYNAVSVDSLDYDNGYFDRNTLVGYFPGTIESVVSQFVMDYTGTASVTTDADDGSEAPASTSISLPSKFAKDSEPDVAE